MERFNNRYKRDMKTAVEWLQEALMTSENAPNYNQWAFNKAKEMEKEQIQSSYHNGARYALISQSDLALSKGKFPTPEQYYNETFKSE